VGNHSHNLTPTIQQLWPHHRSMARLFLEGFQPGEVAAITGFTPGQITRILHSPLFEAELARLESQAEIETVNIGSELKRMASRAIEVLDENLQAGNISRDLKTKTAFDVLDRSGHIKKIDPQRHLHLHAHAHKKVQEMEQVELYDAVEDMLNEDEEVMEMEASD
jgi:hypothetical protein